MLTTADLRNLGWTARDFHLPATNGKHYGLKDIYGNSGTLIMFICNHCPYVIGVLDRLVREANELESINVGVAAICSNDSKSYPEDSFPKMKRFAEKAGFPFPYLHDESQEVAKQYGAVCTPDFFGFNAKLELQYRGRLDSSGKFPAQPDTRRELFLAMKQIAETGVGPEDQVPSMGCSIKWKNPR